VDSRNERIRKITVLTGIIQTVVGNGMREYAGDGGTATQAALSSPQGITFDSKDVVYIADFDNGAVRKVIPVPQKGEIILSVMRNDKPGIKELICAARSQKAKFLPRRQTQGDDDWRRPWFISSSLFLRLGI
jgi:hypothetical protein